MPKKYKVDLRAILSTELIVEANSGDESHDKALTMFKNGEVNMTLADNLADVYVAFIPCEVN